MAIALTSLLFITAGFCGLIALISYHIKRLHLYREAAKFAGPPTLPIIGNAHLLIFSKKDNRVNELMSLTEKYPSPMRIWLVNKLVFALHDAEHIKKILFNSNVLEKGELYKFLNLILGEGIFTAGAEKWRPRRKLIQTTMNQKVLDANVKIFARQSQCMVDLMRKELNKGEFDPRPYVSRCTLDIIAETTTGVKLNAQLGTYTKYFDYLKRMTKLVHIRMYRFWLHPDFIFNMTKYGKSQLKCLNYCYGMMNNMIESKKNTLNNGIQAENKTDAYGEKKTEKDLIDVLTEFKMDGVKLTHEEVRDELSTMIITGNDPSAAVSAILLGMLANFPEIQEKVYQELREIYGDEISSPTPVTKEDLPRMEYMERVIKETMRLFPGTPLFGRAITQDIEIDDRIIPKGSEVFVGLLKIHRSEKYWPDPLKFDPDRFLKEEVAKRHPYCYLPYAGGPRNCIGFKYSMMMMKTLLATILRRYVVTIDKFFKIEDIDLNVSITLKFKEPLTIKIFERTAIQNLNNK